MKTAKVLAGILLILLLADTVFMIIALFKGNMPLIYTAGTILVLLFILSFIVIQNNKKAAKENDGENAV